MNSAAVQSTPTPTQGWGVYATAFFAGAKPDPVMTVSEWADHFRILSQEHAAEPGPWRTYRTPYLKEIMDSLGPQHPAKVVVFVKGSQIGATEAGNNWLGSIIHQRPRPVMMVLPTTDIVKRVSKKRLAKMIGATPELADLVSDPRSRDSSNTIFMKEFPGGSIVMAGANSPAGLRSDPIGDLFLDEVDEFPADCGGQGDPVELAIKRTATYPNHKIFMVSTPTLAGLSRIESAFEETDQRRYFVPCPECNAYQLIEWERIKWEKDADGNALTNTAALECAHCGKLISEHRKTWMLERGEWRPTNPEHANPLRIGFHLSALYSPVGWLSWSEIVAEFVAAKKYPQRLKTWVNTVLGETWHEEGEAEDPELLMQRREPYPTEPIPAGVAVITAGVDIQDDRIEVEIVGWGAGQESWGIDYRVLRGSPGLPEVWMSLDAILTKGYTHPSLPSPMPVAAVCIDTGGHYTTEVYQFCQRRYRRRVFAVKGVGGSGRPIVARPTKQKIAATNRTVKLFPVGVDGAKTAIYSSLKITIPGPGYCHFPARYLDEWFAQLCGEKRVLETNKKTGFVRHVWVKTRANEALDCRVYASAAVAILGADVDDLAKRVVAKAEENQTAAGGSRTAPTGSPGKGDPPVAPTRPRQRPRKSFGGGVNR